MVGNLYVYRRDYSVICKILVDNEFTVTIEYLSGGKAGEQTTISKSTLKRWWKLTTDKVIGAEVESNVNMENLVPMPGIEKLEELKKEYSNNNIYNFISVPSKKGFNLVKLNNKTIAHIYIRNSYILIYLKQKLDDYNYEIKNYKGSFSYLYKVLSESEMYDILNHIKN